MSFSFVVFIWLYLVAGGCLFYDCGLIVVLGFWFGLLLFWGLLWL